MKPPRSPRRLKTRRVSDSYLRHIAECERELAELDVRLMAKGLDGKPALPPATFTELRERLLSRFDGDGRDDLVELLTQLESRPRIDQSLALEAMLRAREEVERYRAAVPRVAQELKSARATRRRREPAPVAWTESQIAGRVVRVGSAPSGFPRWRHDPGAGSPLAAILGDLRGALKAARVPGRKYGSGNLREELVHLIRS